MRFSYIAKSAFHVFPAAPFHYGASGQRTAPAYLFNEVFGNETCESLLCSPYKDTLEPEMLKDLLGSVVILVEFSFPA